MQRLQTAKTNEKYKYAKIANGKKQMKTTIK
jgi:hypothetical protein